MAYETIENGSLGESSLLLMEFKQSCHRMFPFATIFQCSENSIDQSPTCNHNNIEATEKLSNGPTTEKITDGVDSVDDIME